MEEGHEGRTCGGRTGEKDREEEGWGVLTEGKTGENYRGEGPWGRAAGKYMREGHGEGQGGREGGKEGGRT